MVEAPPQIDIGAILENGSEQIEQLLVQLDALGIGKPVVKRVKENNISPDAQKRMGVDMPTKTRYERLGHILACREDETAHIIISTDGELIYVTAHDPTRPNFRTLNYYQNFSQLGEQSLADIYHPESQRDIAATIALNDGLLGIGSLMRSSDPKDTEHVNLMFRQALDLGAKQRDAIMEVRRTTRAAVVGGLKDFLAGGTSGGQK